MATKLEGAISRININHASHHVRGGWFSLSTADRRVMRQPREYAADWSWIFGELDRR